jgi:Lar family restriction alleviation protein
MGANSMSNPINEAAERELLPCPFCGSENVGDVRVMVFCRDCGSEGAMEDHSASAAEYWNRRATQPAPEVQASHGAVVAELLSLAGTMANVMFNYSQKAGEVVSERDATIFRDLYKKWDAMPRPSTDSAALTADEIAFVRMVSERPGQKLNSGETNSRRAEDPPLWQAPQALGYIEAVGSYKWKITDKGRALLADSAADARDAARWRFMLTAAYNDGGPEDMALEKLGVGAMEDDRPESVQMCEMVDAAIAAIQAKDGT